MSHRSLDYPEMVCYFVNTSHMCPFLQFLMHVTVDNMGQEVISLPSSSLCDAHDYMHWTDSMHIPLAEIGLLSSMEEHVWLLASEVMNKTTTTTTTVKGEVIPILLQFMHQQPQQHRSFPDVVYASNRCNSSFVTVFGAHPQQQQRRSFFGFYRERCDVTDRRFVLFGGCSAYATQAEFERQCDDEETQNVDVFWILDGDSNTANVWVRSKRQFAPLQLL